MNDSERDERKLSFGRCPEDYAAVRPGYPDTMFKELFEWAGLPSGARLLEIGCGTGQATVSLAKPGFELLALEPSPELAELARQKLAPFPRVQVSCQTFEDFVVEAPFDMVVAATSFHWLDPAQRLSKSAQVLSVGGRLAVFSNLHLRPYTGFFARVQAVYEEFAPELGEGARADSSDLIQDLVQEIGSSSSFHQTGVKEYSWSHAYSRDDYLRLLGSYSDHSSLPVERREKLFAGVGELIDAEYEGRVAKPYTTLLCLSQRRV